MSVYLSYFHDGQKKVSSFYQLLFFPLFSVFHSWIIFFEKNVRFIVLREM